METIITLSRRDLLMDHKETPISEISLQSFRFLDYKLIRTASIVAFIDNGEVKLLKNRYGYEEYLL